MKAIITKVLLVFLLIFLVGCSNPAVEETEAVLNTYLEGMRDMDYEKLKKTASPEQLAEWPEEPDEVKEIIDKAQEGSTGAFKSWTFEEKPYVDTVNNQAIIKATIHTEKYVLVTEFDIRKFADNWRIYSSEIISQTKL